MLRSPPYAWRLHGGYIASLAPQLTVDDRLPCDDNGAPLYARSAVANELWVSLIEKAWAKLLGSYEALATGHVPEALRA